MKKVSKVIGIILLTAIVIFAGLLVYLTSHEYKPNDIENIAIENSDNAIVLNKNQISILTLNTGYAGIDSDADFFMDGGNDVTSADVSKMKNNLQEILRIIRNTNADFTLLQEVDQNADRSHNFNQVDSYIKQNNLTGSFALNYSCPFVPYPLPPIGKVNAGLLTLTPYQANYAQRVSLPCPFSWPLRTANLKRCLLVNRYPIENCDKELVIINLHLEAYDDDAGKEEQTKMLINFIEEEYNKGNYVIAGGDFNQTFEGGIEKYPIISDNTWTPNVLENSSLPEGWRFAYDLATPSCRLLNKPYDETAEDNQFYTIDGYIISPNVELNNVEVLDYNFKSTDHNPVYLEATLK